MSKAMLKIEQGTKIAPLRRDNKTNFETGVELSKFCAYIASRPIAVNRNAIAVDVTRILLSMDSLGPRLGDLPVRNRKILSIGVKIDMVSFGYSVGHWFSDT